MAGTLTILIVDDNPRMRATARLLLQGVAGTVVECANGLDAVERYDELRPDWVLMDVAMPGLDGIRATQRIRERDPNARVVMVTDFGGADVRAAAAAAGAVGYVTKDDLFLLQEMIR